MSERQKGAARRESVKARPSGRSADQLKIYGDAEDAQASRARRNEKSPKRRKKRRSRTQESIKRRFRAIVDYLSGNDESDNRGPFSFKSRGFWIAIAVAAAIMLLGMTFLEGRNLSVDNTTVTIVGLESELEGYRILLLSDLRGRRFGDRQSTLLREIDTLGYDIVLMTGDMVGPGGDPEPFYELLEGLPSRKKVYFIAGDSDPGPFVREARAESGKLDELVLEDWILGAQERGAIYVDAPVQVTVSTTSFWLTPASLLNLNLADSTPALKEQMEQEQSGYLSGIQADQASLPFTSYRYENAQQALSALERMESSQLHISLAHVPPSSAFIRATSTHAGQSESYLGQPELILAGHYCGGVWRLPLLGAFYIPNSTAPRYGWFPAQTDAAGLSSTGETQLYISRGLSVCSDAPLMAFRLLNRPQISILTLTATLPTSMLDD